MDFQRYLLIGASAALSFMLLTEWVQFKDEKKAEATAAVYQQQTTQASSTAAFSNDDFPEPQAVDNTTDLPSVQTVVNDIAATTTTVSNVVRITTDTLVVDINTKGGDIVYSALPKYFAKIDTPDVPFTLLEQSPLRTYIAESGLIGSNGIDTSKGRAQYSSSASSYTLQENQNELTVDLVHVDDKGNQVIKRFRFHRGEYLVDVEYVITNNSSEAWSANMFGQIKRDNTEDPSASSSGMGLSPYLGAAIHLTDEPYKKVSFADIKEAKFDTVTVDGGWVAILQHYFVSAWIPDPAKTHTYSTAIGSNQSNIIRFTSPAVTVSPGETTVIKSQFYTGPKDQYSLEEISPGLELTVDYGLLWWIAQPLFWLLTKLHGFLGNWGFSIIAVTILVKVLFFQLNAKAYTSMANMRKVQPKLVELKERYKDDKQKQSQEMMSLYKKEKINPLGGCLPILVQMPVFISLYWVLMESVELRHAPFIGYIVDLSVMDPYYILPLIMGVSMFIQQKLNPPPPDPMQAKVMQWMPVMFTFFFLFFPAGLVLYWVVNNTLSIVQQYIITKRIENS
jgi:YidC/Oxa1 family membrane protein insertase